MKATLLVFKSGASVTVYHKEDDAVEDSVDMLREGEVSLILDVTENTKNEAKWLAEHREKLVEREINGAKVKQETRDTWERMAKIMGDIGK